MKSFNKHFRNQIALSIFVAITLSLLLGACGSKSEKDYSLFDGSGLDNWADSGNNAFTLSNGILETTAPGWLLYTGKNASKFKNFDFQAEVKTSGNARAAIHFHAEPDEAQKSEGYRIQILNGYNDSDFRKTGSLTAIRDVYKAIVNDNDWFTLRISVQYPRVQVFANEVMLVEYYQPETVNRSGITQNMILSQGTFAIESIDGGVSFRNITVKTLPDTALPYPENDYFTPEKQQMVDNLIAKGYPLIDYHVHMKGDVTLADILQKSQRTGIFCSVAPNCGVGFPIDTNAKLEEFYTEYKDVPIFLAMQAEGREWVTTFEKESIAKYDYVFTDAMTFSDRNGNRMQIWKDEQVNITDPQDFMELLVETIEDVLDKEKIDIYVNATFLPTAIADQYDQLWTSERMERVINALVRNDIALEISARYQIPSAEFIRLAKDKGVKFTFGTNNGDHDFANLDYCFEMINECDLQPADFFLPRPEGLKPVQTKL